MWPVVCTVDRDIVLQLLSSCEMFDCERFTVFVLPYSGCCCWCCDCCGMCKCSCDRWFFVEFEAVAAAAPVALFRFCCEFDAVFSISGISWTVNSISLRMSSKSSNSWWRSTSEEIEERKQKYQKSRMRSKQKVHKKNMRNHCAVRSSVRC